MSELIWRDFYHQVMHHHPHVVSRSFKAPYDHIKWEHGKHADALFAAWREGRPGYPLVDPATAHTNPTGHMHNGFGMAGVRLLVKSPGNHSRLGLPFVR